MATYRVAFDGKWQERFDDREEALEWAREVAETGRIVHVARSGVRRRLIAVFPEGQAHEGKWLWNIRQGWGTGWRGYKPRP
jgi:hypothetical protein